MAEEGFKRKLTAILSADVIGYSRLMRDNEEATVRDLAAHRVLISDIIQQHHGRVVDSPGDNILAEFASVVDAVNGAIKIQEEIKKSNTGVPEDRRMEFRIGVNLGDVIEEEERIYGDGVNIAARVEGLADGGGIAISGTVYEHIKEKLSLGYHYLGEQEVKNISEPVRVYRLLTEPADAGKMIDEKKPKSKKLRWAVSGAVALFVLVVGAFAIWNYYLRPPFEPASEEKMAFPLPEKPSIAVMPFDNMSSDPEQEYFSDGISENIITALSKVRNIFVIARNSSFTYKGKPVKIQQVAEELGVQYVLEGSVQKTKNQVRITAQLIDALTGKHLWAERYDRELNDIFAIQDEITKKVITALQVKLTEGEQARITEKGTKSLDAYLKLLQAWKHTQAFNKEELVLARRFAQEALSIDPDYALAYSTLAAVYVLEVFIGASKSPKDSLSRAEEMANKALALDGSLVHAHSMLSLVYIFKRKFKEAIKVAEQAVALGPNDDYANFMLGSALMHSERFEEAIPYFKKSLRLRPHPLIQCLNNLAASYRFLGRYDEAIVTYSKLLKLQPDHLTAHLNLAATYVFAGREEDARREAEDVMRIDPKFSLDRYAKRIPYRKELVAQLVEAWRKAGLPEHPPLKLPDRPSIAVLPFDNLSKDPEQEYFADGMIDDLITDLSKISGLFVIARNSTFQYKGKAVDVKKVSRELNIRYVLEGSVRKAGDKVRINAQLIDATTGGHLWAERYDGRMDDIFSLQDKITQKIVAALAVKLTPDEKENIVSKGTNNIEAYDAFMKGWQHYLRWTPKDVAAAIKYFEKAIELDPEYYNAYAAMALTYDSRAGEGPEWTKALQADYFSGRAKARQYLDMAMKKPTALAYRVASWMDLRRRQHDKALREIEKAIAISPNDAEVQFGMARILVYTGKPKEAIEVIEKVMLLDPNKMADCLYLSGIAYFCMEQYDKSISLFERASNYNPNLYVEKWFAINYAYLGQQKDAEIAFEKYKKRWLGAVEGSSIGAIPKLDIQPAVYNNPFKDSKVTERYVNGIIKAGHPKPHRYWEVSKGNKLTGDEIRDLVIGRTIISPVFAGGSWTMKTGKDGSAIYEGYGMKDSGRNWIEDDQFCSQFKKYLAGLKSCGDLYRNPKGILERRDEYLLVADQGIFPISFID